MMMMVVVVPVMVRSGKCDSGEGEDSDERNEQFLVHDGFPFL